MKLEHPVHHPHDFCCYPQTCCRSVPRLTRPSSSLICHGLIVAHSRFRISNETQLLSVSGPQFLSIEEHSEYQSVRAWRGLEFHACTSILPFPLHTHNRQSGSSAYNKPFCHTESDLQQTHEKLDCCYVFAEDERVYTVRDFGRRTS